MKLGLGLGIGGGNGLRRKERLYAINASGEQELVYDVNGEPIYLKRES